MQVIQRKPSIFGALGKCLGEGIANHVPKEIERQRLAKGLKTLGEQKDLTPFQQFAELSGIPGVTPQMIQSGSELLRQQGMLKGAQNQNSQAQGQFDAVKNQKQNTEGSDRGLIDKEKTQAALQPSIPKSLRELQSRAVELNQESPGLYPDYQAALQAAAQEDQQRIAQNTAQRAARESQRGVENDVRKELRGLQSAANANVPDNVYQKIEDQALDAIKNGEKDELTATKDATKELDAISRDYKSIDNLGNITLIASNPKEVISSINSLRKKFKANDDLENFADSLVARNGLSNQFAYSLAKPPPENISKLIKDSPSLKAKAQPVAGAGIGFTGVNKAHRKEQTQNLIKKIAPLLNKDDSPLAISQLLDDKGYDSQLWRDYLLENSEKLNLSKSQSRELDKVDKISQGFLNDWFLKIFGGL